MLLCGIGLAGTLIFGKQVLEVKGGISDPLPLLSLGGMR
jgi:hypothetical protein